MLTLSVFLTYQLLLSSDLDPDDAALFHARIQSIKYIIESKLASSSSVDSGGIHLTNAAASYLPSLRPASANPRSTSSAISVAPAPPALRELDSSNVSFSVAGLPKRPASVSRAQRLPQTTLPGPAAQSAFASNSIALQPQPPKVRGTLNPF
jgi:hypothetical protein